MSGSVTAIVVIALFCLSIVTLPTQTPSSQIASGGGDETVKQSATTNQVETHEVSSKEQEHATIYQNIEWSNAVSSDLTFLQADLGACAESEKSYDYETIVTNGRTLVKDVQISINNNKKFNVSPEYQSAQQEWDMALRDISDAGNESIQIGLDGMEGKSYSDHAKKEQTLVLSFNAHAGRTGAFMTNANKLLNNSNRV